MAFFYMTAFRHVLGIGLLFVFATGMLFAQEPLRVGSKRFTESYILGELIAITARQGGETAVEHKPGLGNTAILFQALKSGAIDLYPEYTGTIAHELLGLQRVPPLAELNQRLALHGLKAGIPLGFGNSYALAVSEDQARARNLNRISDLGKLQSFRAGLTAEFLNRKDGWPALRDRYHLDNLSPLALEHGLAYDALARGHVDVIDIYTTDPRLSSSRLRVLEDDLHYFPEYRAVLLFRVDLQQRFPRAWAALGGLDGAIPAAAMIRMNAAVELDGRRYAAVAEDWSRGQVASMPVRPTLLEVLFDRDLPRLTLQHVVLVLVSLLLSVACGIPLGVLAQRHPRAGRWILSLTGLLQTIPSLALLAFFVATLNRIGAVPAILALFLYALLPIVRSTETALTGIGRGVRDAGRALGLDARQGMMLIELPLAMPGILSGIKTAAVINVGTATVAAFIGAGGFGERIVAGLAVNDHTLLLAGAIPAGLLALTVEWAFRALDGRLARCLNCGPQTP